jgi:hypothetical protein
MAHVAVAVGTGRARLLLRVLAGSTDRAVLGTHTSSGLGHTHCWLRAHALLGILSTAYGKEGVRPSTVRTTGIRLDGTGQTTTTTTTAYVRQHRLSTSGRANYLSVLSDTGDKDYPQYDILRSASSISAVYLAGGPY